MTRIQFYASVFDSRREELFLISDLVRSASGYSRDLSVAQSSVKEVEILRSQLDDVVIGGVNASSSSLSLLAELGDRYHKEVFNYLEPHFLSGAFNVSEAEIVRVIS